MDKIVQFVRRALAPWQGQWTPINAPLGFAFEDGTRPDPSDFIMTRKINGARQYRKCTPQEEGDAQAGYCW